jgi:hypothetical protein
MQHRFRTGVVAATGLCLALSAGAAALAQTASSTPAPATAPASGAMQKGTAVTNRATGTFDVKLAPQQDEGSPLGRMTIDKQFHGGIDGTSKGQMLSVMTAVKGSGGYVALEQVTGSLEGRKGTFCLQHNGTMTRGTPSLALAVVPDSGTDQLAGLTGTMTIDIAPDGKHSYTFQYAIAPQP